jgi:DUF1009 family protein
LSFELSEAAGRAMTQLKTQNSKLKTPVGLIAAWGRFPIAFAEKARAVGVPVVCVGLRGLASEELAGLVPRFYWARPTQMGKMIRCLRREGVTRAVLAGKLPKADILHKPWKIVSLWPDWRTVRFWWFRPRRDNRDDNVLLAVIDEFARDGIRIESALDLCPELLVNPGVLTRRPPTAREQADIAFGWELARKMGGLDVGQSVAVKELAVLAVEAIEGTDRMILRAGELCRAGGFTVVKVAKPRQDMRFDVPTVGTSTIESIRRAGGRVLAVEAGRTILLDQAETIALAESYGISLVAWTDAQALRQTA